MHQNNNKILILGSGGREHALAWKLAQSSNIQSIYVSPGNAGTAQCEKCQNVALQTIEEQILFAKEYAIDCTIVGPEALLVEGIADRFQDAGLTIFAPNQRAAQLEGSKAFAKEFMKKYGVKTAKFERFTNALHAKEYLNMVTFPIVIKASGLAAGKGVVICGNFQQGLDTIDDMMTHNSFGSAGHEIVIEEFLEGFEASILSICDGQTVLPFISAKDHKKIGEGETGLNTGGMGVIAPNPLFTQQHYQEFLDEIVRPTLEGLESENMAFMGVIFFGLMITKNGVYLLEYNVRFGDPETQAVLPLMTTDLFDIIQDALSHNLASSKIEWKQQHACCVVAVSGGYPKEYEKNKIITIDNVIDHCQVFIAGAEMKNGEMLTSGGRVLNIVSEANSLDEARNLAYEEIKNVHFDKMFYRKDIGLI